MTSHTCPDCMRGLPCERPVESSLSRVVADAVNRPTFQPPVYFGHTPTDSDWKREAFPNHSETM